MKALERKNKLLEDELEKERENVRKSADDFKDVSLLQKYILALLTNCFNCTIFLKFITK